MTISVSPTEADAFTALRSVISGMFSGAVAFTGSINGPTLIVASVESGALVPGMPIAGTGLLRGTTVGAFLGGTGGVGTYQVSPSQVIAPGTKMYGGIVVVRGQANRVPEVAAPDFMVMTATRRQRLATNFDDVLDCKFVASISGDQLSVTAVDQGALKVGSRLFGPNLTAGTIITAFTGAATGGIGIYLVAPSQTVASQVMSAGTQNMAQTTELNIQIDVHGPNGADNAQRLSTLMRDDYGVQAFAAVSDSVSPLYADDPRQIPFINGEDQYEDRWIVEACLQVEDVVMDVPQEFADSVVVGLKEVDTTYPP